MRRALLLMALCAMPVGATAQTWIPGDSYIIGNTLIPGSPVLLASGKGPGRGTSAPAPSPAPSPAPAAAPSFGGRAESGFTYPQPIRVQVQGPTVSPPSTLPAPPPITVELPPIVGVSPVEGNATLSIPVQVLYRQAGEASGRRLPVDPGYGIPAVPSFCPACPVTPPEVTPPVPVPTPMPMAAPQPRYRVCNAHGACIPWP